MSVDRNVIITTGEEVVTPQKAERILAACTPARAKGQAIKAAEALEGFLRLQYERGKQARAEAEDAVKSGQFVLSNEDGCRNCNNLCYDLDTRHHVCRLNYRPVQPFTPPCLFFSRILQGFGE